MMRPHARPASCTSGEDVVTWQLRVRGVRPSHFYADKWDRPAALGEGRCHHHGRSAGIGADFKDAVAHAPREIVKQRKRFLVQHRPQFHTIDELAVCTRCPVSCDVLDMTPTKQARRQLIRQCSAWI